MAEPVVREPLDGGVEPDVGAVLNATIADFTDDIGPYVMASLGHTLVLVPIIFAAIFIFYIVFFVLLMGGSVGLAVVAVMITELLGEAAGGLSMLGSQLIMIFGMFVLFFAFISGIAAITAPLNASLTRSVAAYQRGEGTLDISAAFSSAGQDIVKVVMVSVVMGCLALVLVSMCYIPVLIIPLMFGFTTAMVSLHRLGPISAFTTSLAHFQKHPKFHLMFGALTLALNMVASYVPVLGPAFMVALHVRAYREMFGDGEEMVF